MKPLTLPRACVLVVLPCLSGCVGMYRSALAPEAMNHLSDTAGVIALNRHEIGTSIKGSNVTQATGGGLIPALIDAVVDANSARKAEKSAADLRQAMLDFKFEDVASEALRDRFAGGGGLGLSSIVVVQDQTMSDLPRIVANAPGEVVAVCYLTYLLGPNFAEIAVLADVIICAKSADLTMHAKMHPFAGKQVAVLYRNAFQSIRAIFTSATADDASGPDSALTAAERRARDIIRSLRTACAETAAMWEWDMALPPGSTARPSGTQNVTIPIYHGNRIIPVSAFRCQSGRGQRAWYRSADGRLYARPF